MKKTLFLQKSRSSYRWIRSEESPGTKEQE